MNTNNERVCRLTTRSREEMDTNRVQNWRRQDTERDSTHVAEGAYKRQEDSLVS